MKHFYIHTFGCVALGAALGVGGVAIYEKLKNRSEAVTDDEKWVYDPDWKDIPTEEEAEVIVESYRPTDVEEAETITDVDAFETALANMVEDAFEEEPSITVLYPNMLPHMPKENTLSCFWYPGDMKLGTIGGYNEDGSVKEVEFGDIWPEYHASVMDNIDDFMNEDYYVYDDCDLGYFIYFELHGGPMDGWFIKAEAAMDEWGFFSIPLDEMYPEPDWVDPERDE